MLRSLFARSRPVFRPFCWTQQRCSSSGWQVSSCGRVRFPTGKVSYGHLSCSGYRYVQIDKQGHSVHRLVAAAFLGPPPDPTCWQVNHNDCEPGNNHVSNLQYATNSANQKHSYATNSGRQSSAAKLAKAVLWRPVGEESWTFCPSQREAARLLGVWPSAVRMCCSGLINKSNGNGVWYEFKVAPTVAPGRPSDEVWRPARYPGWSGVIPNLLVSNKGRVSQTKSEAFHSGTRSRSGYYVVTRVGRKLYVQRLVAATFLGQPQSPDHQVNHKDRNRGNNHLANLEYVTQSENMRHANAYAHSEGKAPKPRTPKPVLARLLGGAGSWLEFESIKAAAAHTGVIRRKVSRICHGLDSNVSWEFRFAPEEQLPGEEWRPVVLEGVRRPSGLKMPTAAEVI